MRESPLIVMPGEIFALEDMDKIEDWLDRQINDKINSEQREIFFSLADSRYFN